MNNLDYNTTVTLAAFIFGVGIGALLLLSIMASVYIKQHKDELAENNELVEPCKKAASKLVNQYPTFMNNIQSMGLSKVYSCSRSVVSGASNNPIKYLVKYSEIDNSLEDLERIDFCISYLKLLSHYKDFIENIRDQVSKSIPLWVRMFSSKEKLPYTICGINKKSIVFPNPAFRFSYVSPAGKSGANFTIYIDRNALEDLRLHINSKISKAGHMKAQRSAMSNDLREAIKKRDNYTCCICGNSVFNEPNLLLEVDHIIPVAQGGKTVADNLQTLCWRCNRAKRDKIIQEE